MQSTDVSVIIISYNTRELTHACLASVYRQTHGVSFEVIVVDNASDDGSAEMVESCFPDVRLISSEENLGFGRGNNLAAERANGRYLLLLNPDTTVKDNAIKALFEFAETNPEAGAWGGVCELPNGQIDPGCRQIMPGLWTLFANFFVRYRRIANRMDRSQDFQGDVPVLSGAFMMVRSDVWRETGGFDESFKLYAEECDLCYSILKAQYRIMLTGKARVVHYGGAVERGNARNELNQTRGVMQFFRKHYPTGAATVAGLLIWLYSIERMVVASLAIPFAGMSRCRALCRRLSIVALHPSRWWYGWRGQEL